MAFSKLSFFYSPMRRTEKGKAQRQFSMQERFVDLRYHEVF